MSPQPPQTPASPAAANKPTAWDDYAGAPSVLSVEVMQPTEPWVIRAHFRTHPFDIATAALAAARPDGPTLAAAAGEEYRLRVEVIMRPADGADAVEIAAGKKALAAQSSWRRAALVFAIAVSLVGLYVVVADGGIFDIGYWVRAATFIGAAWLLAFASRWITDSSMLADAAESQSHLRERLEDRCCCDCGYGLTGVPPGLPVQAAGADVGPARCPECNAAWPLVPGRVVLTGRYPLVDPAAGVGAAQASGCETPAAR